MSILYFFLNRDYIDCDIEGDRQFSKLRSTLIDICENGSKRTRLSNSLRFLRSYRIRDGLSSISRGDKQTETNDTLSSSKWEIENMTKHRNGAYEQTQ